MANLFLCEPDERYRKLLRYILEGVHHSVSEAGGYAEVPERLAAEPADLLILGAHPEAGNLADPGWQASLPEMPTLLLLGGTAASRAAFVEAWQGPPNLKLLAQPVDPYPLLSAVKSMLAQPETWRRGGQHSV